MGMTASIGSRMVSGIGRGHERLDRGGGARADGGANRDRAHQEGGGKHRELAREEVAIEHGEFLFFIRRLVERPDAVHYSRGVPIPNFRQNLKLLGMFSAEMVDNPTMCWCALPITRWTLAG